MQPGVGRSSDSSTEVSDARDGLPDSLSDVDPPLLPTATCTAQNEARGVPAASIRPLDTLVDEAVAGDWPSFGRSSVIWIG